MFFDNPMLFDQAIQELLPHLAHRITITHYGGDAAPDSVAIECQDCHELLIDFVPEPSVGATRSGTGEIRSHYDADRDVCCVEVFKPGKSPYPMQERQDIVNHSPTGIAWGYGGSRPTQCALAWYSARRISSSEYSQWRLTGRQIENAISKMAHRKQRY